MASIDDRVVSLKFNNGQFESGAKQTINTLEKLKQSLNLSGAGKGLDNLQNAGKNVKLDHISSSLDHITSKFSALSVVGVAALGTIAAKATATGASLVKSLTIAPVTGGLHEYETQLNAVQTILANTQSAGTSLKDVNKALQELNVYSDKTIYNFTEMARNIGTFTAAGVDLETATGAIKGIANLAALSGSNSQQASTAMYQLSQAISAGRVSLQDWNSVVNAGMGGTVFQRALAQTAVQMGTLSEGAVKLKGKMKNVSIEGESFRQSIQAGPGKESWLTSDVLTKTLEQFTGDLSKAELAAMGFNDAQIRSIQQTATTAQKAATEVKTLSGVFSTAKETAESGWAQTWQNIFGDFGEAKSLFTGISEGLNGLINRNAAARNKVLSDWKKLGGRSALIDSFKNIAQAISGVLKPIREAFRDIFPAKTGQDLFNLTQKFQQFTESLKIGSETAENIKRTFRGVFAIFSIAKQIIGGVIGVFANLVGAAGKGSGGFLELTGSIGDFLVSLDKALKEGSGLRDFFGGLSKILAAPISLLGKLAEALGSLFSGGDASGSSAFASVINGIGSAIEKVLGLFHELGGAISDALGGADFNTVLDSIRTVLLGGIAVIIAKFVKGGLSGFIGGGGFMSRISGAFEDLTDTLKAMQHNVQASTLLKIAAAVGILSVSMVMLSKIDSSGLTKALTAMAVGFAQLLGAMAILTKIAGAGGFLKIPFIAASMIALGVAINVLALAVKSLSKLSWGELGKGLTGVAALLVVISAASVPLSANSAGMIRAGVGLMAVSVALKVLASVVKDFGSMDLSTMGKGLLGVAGALVAVGAAMWLIPPTIAITGVGLIAVATGLRILAGAVSTFGDMNLSTVAKGLGAIVASLVLIGVAVAAIPATLAIQAAGLVILSVALGGIAASVGLMGNMKVETLAKGLGALAGALVILAVGLNAMSGAVLGAAALAITAGALALIVPPLILLGQQSIGSIVKGLVALSGAFVVLGVAGALLTPMVPSLIGLGAALVLVGAGVALIGGGVAALAAGLGVLGTTGAAGVAILVRSFLELIKTIPILAVALAKGFVEIVKTVANAAPQLVTAFGKILTALFQSIIIAAPKMGEAFVTVVLTALAALNRTVPALIQTGLNLLRALLTGIAGSIGEITATTAKIIVGFLTALTSAMPKLVAAGAKALVSFLKGLAQDIGGIVKAAGDVVAEFLKGLANKAPAVIKAGAQLLTKVLKGIADNLSNVVSAAGKVVASFVKGIGDGAGRIVKSATSTVLKFAAELGRSAVQVAKGAGRIILQTLQGIRAAVEQYAPEITAEGLRIGVALVEGIAQGILTVGMEKIRSAVSSLSNAIPGWAKKFLGVHSPARVMIPIGMQVSAGLAKGIDDGTPIAQAAAKKSAKKVFNAYKSAIYQKSMRPVGEYLSDEFLKGLLGPSFIDKTALAALSDELKSKLDEAVNAAKDGIKEKQAIRQDLRERGKKDSKSYREAGKAIADYQKALKQAKETRKAFRSDYADELKELDGLHTKYNDVSEKLRNAQTALQSLVDARDNAAKSYSDKFSELPSMKNENDQYSLSLFVSRLQSQVQKVKYYNETLQRLRAAGLDDETYKLLIDEGVDGQAFADQILAGGASAITTLKDLTGQLKSEAGTLGTNAANNLYQAGIDAAKGLVDGLKNELEDPESGIIAQIKELAKKMVAAFKKELKIKSPSRVFMELGRFTGAGLANGLRESTKNVTNASTSLGEATVDTLQSAMQKAATLFTEDIYANPVVAPVLDLTQLEAESKRIADLTSVGSISPDASYSQASVISVAAREMQRAVQEMAQTQAPIKFEQNNYSPEALSAVEIYRQTNNQLSRAKALLTV